MRRWALKTLTRALYIGRSRSCGFQPNSTGARCSRYGKRSLHNCILTYRHIARRQLLLQPGKVFGERRLWLKVFAREPARKWRCRALFVEIGEIAEQQLTT